MAGYRRAERDLTPTSIDRLIIEIIEFHRGRILDPAYGARAVRHQ